MTHAVVTIGFESTLYTVRESDGSVQIQISLFNASETFDQDATVNVWLNTVPGSGPDPADSKHAH